MGNVHSFLRSSHAQLVCQKIDVTLDSEGRWNSFLRSSHAHFVCQKIGVTLDFEGRNGKCSFVFEIESRSICVSKNRRDFRF